MSSKVITKKVRCNRCSTTFPVSIVESEVGGTKQLTCPKCKNHPSFKVPMEWASFFVEDRTEVTEGGLEKSVTPILSVCESADEEYQSFELKADYYTVGRKNDGDPIHRPDIPIVTTNRKMSRIHAIIRKRGNGKYTIKDAGSMNGVVCNGAKLSADEEVYLRGGDTIVLGGTKINVAITDASADLVKV